MTAPATFDAVICANDIMALGSIDAARQDYRLKVPEDVSVVGFDGASPGTWLSYRLTTIEQPIKMMAEAAVNMLMERIETPHLPTEKRMFSGLFIEGGSARLG